jgi:hypothetical protein
VASLSALESSYSLLFRDRQTDFDKHEPVKDDIEQQRKDKENNKRNHHNDVYVKAA